MQEDIEHRAVTLAMNVSKMTGRTFRNALVKLLHFLKTKHQQHQQHQQVKPRGKQSVKKLIGQNQGVSRVDLSHDDDVKQFEHVARKYGVDYAITKVKGEKPRYLIFFKARDNDVLTAALEEYTAQRVRGKDKSSLHSKLQQPSLTGQERAARQKEVSR